MEEGKVTASGSYNAIVSKTRQYFSKGLKAVEDTSLSTAERSVLFPSLVQNKDRTNINMKAADDENTINRQKGTWSVYTYYFRSAGYGLLGLFLAFTIIEAFCSSFQSLYPQI
jgi:surface antigen